jgi:molybdenum cofactor synthesis domain-containing protein
MIALDEAQAFVLHSLSALAPVDVALDEVLGCVGAEELIAHEPVPGFSNSSMDGFALRSSDTLAGSVRLRVTDSVRAGDVSSLRLEGGEAMRIMTGAPLPDGADCVCMIEEATVEDGGRMVRINRTISHGEFVRRPGEDIAIGQVLVSPGDELSAARVGVLASQGFTSLSMFPRPRVGVLSTGNELSHTTGPLRSGEIRDVNRPLLLALLRHSGFEPIDLGTVGDEYAQISRRLHEAVRACDAVVSTGGVSVGEVDHVKAVISELGGESSRWMQVAIKPGKPFAFGVVGARRTPLFGLPGNPVSTRVSFELFVRPALRLMAGHLSIERLTLNAVLDCALPRPSDGKLHLVHVIARVHEDGLVHVESAMRQGSHLLSATVRANALAMVPDGAGLAVGEHVRTMIFDADQLSAPSP